MKKETTHAYGIMLLAIIFLSTGVSALPGNTTLMVMKHQCPASIQTEQNFTSLESQGGGNPIFALALAVRACPTIRNPGNLAVNGTLAGANTNFAFQIIDSNNVTHNWQEGKFVNAKICETDLNFDINGDGFIGNSPQTNLTKNFCTLVSRNVSGGCSNFLHLVCGWTAQNDTLSYSNPQCACQNPAVSFWTEGVCLAQTLNSPTCMDVSHYEFNVPSGPTIVQEIAPPSNSRFGTLRFTPTQLSPNNDKDSLVSFGNGSIMLNTQNDSDGKVMLHVYNFAGQNATGNASNQTTAKTTTIQIMKHICPGLTSIDDLHTLWGDKSAVDAFMTSELACPVVLLPGEEETLNASFGGNFAYDFSVTSENGTFTLAQSTLDREKICETDAGVDFNNDGSISPTDCVDISHHALSGLKSGMISVQETTAPENYTFGTVVFTPAQLNNEGGDYDGNSLVSINNGVITLNSSKDPDGMIMLHVYNFRKSNVTVPINNSNVSNDFSCTYGGETCSLISDTDFRGCRNLVFSTIDGNLKLTLCNRGDHNFDLYRKSVPGNKNFTVCFMNGCVSNKNNFVFFKVKQHPEFDASGNVLISDQFNNRVVEIDPVSKQIVWSFGSSNPILCNPGNGTVIGTNWAERISDGLTVIAGTGIPSGVISEMPDGCADNRVIVVNKNGDIVWQYGQAGVAGSDQNELNVPVSAVQLPNKDFLITDQGNNRIIEVNHDKQVVWQYGPTSGSGALDSPNSAEMLANGNILIADENNNRAIEINKRGKIVWEYDAGGAVAFASRLLNGNTIITDAQDARIFIVSHNKKVLFEYFTNTTSDSNPNPLPTNAVKLKDGDISIADQFNHRVFIVNQDKQITWQYGMTNNPGNGGGQLYGPYTSFVIGDYTGQTVPPKHSGII